MRTDISRGTDPRASQSHLFRPRRYLVVDGHPIVVGALIGLLRSLDAEAVIDKAGSMAEAMLILSTHAPPDLIILDLTLPDARDFEGLEQLRSMYKNSPVVIFTADEHPETVWRALELGACGYLPKSFSEAELADALDFVRRGHIYVPARLLQSSLMGGAARLSSAKSRLALDELPLSDRQRAILELVLVGYPNKLIARRLGLALSTTKNHVSTILRTLGVRSRAEAIIKLSRSDKPSVDQ